jgi:hypothetical protein
VCLGGDLQLLEHGIVEISNEHVGHMNRSL